MKNFWRDSLDHFYRPVSLLSFTVMLVRLGWCNLALKPLKPIGDICRHRLGWVLTQQCKVKSALLKLLAWTRLWLRVARSLCSGLAMRSCRGLRALS